MLEYGLRGGRYRALLLSGLLLVIALCAAFNAQVAVAALAGVDNGFENGTDGASLVPSWTLNGAPLRYEYDNAQAKSGALSAWIQGPGAAYGGIASDAISGMGIQGAELRFWAYFDTANQNRVVTDGGATELRWDTAGQMLLYHQSATTGYIAGYTNVGTYSTGWTQYRIVYDFAGGAVTVSSRAAVGDPWTQHKSTGAPDYNIPMRNTVAPTQTGSLLFRTYANMWVDEVQYTDHTAPVIAVSGVADGQSYSAPLTVTYSATDDVDDPVSASATMNGGAFASGTAVSVPGSYTLVVTSTDSTGNSATTTTNFTIAAAPPVVSTPASSAWTLALAVLGGAAIVGWAERRRRRA